MSQGQGDIFDDAAFYFVTMGILLFFLIPWTISKIYNYYNRIITNKNIYQFICQPHDRRSVIPLFTNFFGYRLWHYRSSAV